MAMFSHSKAVAKTTHSQLPATGLACCTVILRVNDSVSAFSQTAKGNMFPKYFYLSSISDVHKGFDASSQS